MTRTSQRFLTRFCLITVMSRTTLNGSHINAPTSPEPKTQRLIIHRVVQQYDRPPTSPGSDLRLPQSYRSYLARCALLCGKIFQCNCRPMHFVNFLCYKAFMREILWRLPAANCRRSFVPLFNPHADENAFWKNALMGNRGPIDGIFYREACHVEDSSAWDLKKCVWRSSATAFSVLRKTITSSSASAGNALALAIKYEILSSDTFFKLKVGAGSFMPCARTTCIFIPLFWDGIARINRWAHWWSAPGRVVKGDGRDDNFIGPLE